MTSTARLAAIAMIGAAITLQAAAGDSWTIAQATTAPSAAERIRAQAARLKEYRDLLADRDANVRLAALDEMLKSSDPALRELAYEAGFASPETALRALALRARILSAKTLAVEIYNAKSVPDEQWAKVLGHFSGDRHVFDVDKADPATGNFMSRGHQANINGLELTTTFSGGALRLRLSEGTTMLGTVTYSSVTVPARLVLR